MPSKSFCHFHSEVVKSVAPKSPRLIRKKFREVYKVTDHFLIKFEAYRRMQVKRVKKWILFRSLRKKIGWIPRGCWPSFKTSRGRVLCPHDCALFLSLLYDTPKIFCSMSLMKCQLHYPKFQLLTVQNSLKNIHKFQFARQLLIKSNFLHLKSF